MLADPQSVTISGSAKTLPRTAPASVGAGRFTDATGEFQLDVSNSANSKRKRQIVKLTDTKLVADAYVPTTNVATSASVHLVMDAPLTGYTAAEMLALAKGFVASLTDAQLTKIIGLEV